MAATVVPNSLIANLKVLNLTNYEDWSFRVKTYLLAEDLWDVVEATNEDEPPKREDGEAEFKAWRKNDAKALYAIQSTCGDDTYCFIRTATTSKDAWNTLAAKLKPAEASNTTTADHRSVLQAYPTPIDRDARVQGELAVEEGRFEGTQDPTFIHKILTGLEESNADVDIQNIYEALISLMKNEDWDNAMLLLDKYPNAAGARFSDGGTALHAAITSTKWTLQKKVEIGKKLVRLMAAADLEVRDAYDFNALYLIIGILPEADELVKCMFEKNNNIIASSPPFSPTIPGTPLYMAQATEYGEKMARYLYSITPHGTLSVAGAAHLICEGLKFKRFDIAWDLIQRYPNLALAKNLEGGTRTPLTQLAGMRSAFLSGNRLRFWEQWIYDGIHIKPTPTINGIPINVQKLESDQSNQRHPIICSVMGIFRGLVVTNLLKVHLGIFNYIYQMKLIHVRILEFLHIMCKVLEDKPLEELKGLGTAMFLATERGHVEYLTHLCRANGSFLSITNEKGRSLFQFAIECRQEKVYDLTYSLAEFFQIQKTQVGLRDEFNNTVLHMVGSFSSLAQISNIRGAALQMQRELQWFKEVESVTGPAALEVVNLDHMTPRELFTKNHQELVKEGEKSMKETASSCTVVGALIVTMTFAAAFTYPGGNNGDTGLPVFLKKMVFVAFIVSDAISLFSSTTSVMIFLGILTSRYAEDDFLKSLPRKMILGLLTLFLSIASMMFAFSSALYLMLDGKSSIVAPVILLSCVPIASFIWMQFPFLLVIFISTYGAGIFDRKVKNLY